MKMLPVTMIPLEQTKKSYRALRDTIPGGYLLVGQGDTELPLTRVVSWITHQALYFYCASFETNPSPQSGFKLCLFPKSEACSLKVYAEFTPLNFTWKVEGVIEGRAEQTEQEETKKQVLLQRDGGENLEGVFWGGTLEIPLYLLQNKSSGEAADLKLIPGYIIEGSLCKYCTSLPYVYAANLFDREKFFRGEFVLCSY